MNHGKQRNYRLHQRFHKTKKTIFWLFKTRIINNELKEEKLLFRFSQWRKRYDVRKLAGGTPATAAAAVGVHTNRNR